MPTYSLSSPRLGSGGLGDAFRMLATAPYLRERHLADQSLAEARGADAAIKRLQLEALQGLGSHFSDPRTVALMQAGQGNADALARAYAEMQQQGYVSDIVAGAGGVDPTRVGQAYYATSGKAPYTAEKAGAFSPISGAFVGRGAGAPSAGVPSVPGAPAPAPKPQRPVGPPELLWLEEYYRGQGVSPAEAKTKAYAEYNAKQIERRSKSGGRSPVTGLPPEQAAEFAPGLGYEPPPGVGPQGLAPMGPGTPPAAPPGRYSPGPPRLQQPSRFEALSDAERAAVLTEAATAIRAGKSRDAVNARLREWGFPEVP